MEKINMLIQYSNGNTYVASEQQRQMKQKLYNFYQRSLDIVLAIIGLIIGIPLMFAFGIAIILESRGKIFYSQERMGKNGQVFKVYKLRSMVSDAEKNGPQWASKNDTRVTKVGKVIRKTRIDELPQLVNVLKGEMSIIGPRPERPEFTIQFNQEIPGFFNRLQVKPGLTGWAQVNGGYEMTPSQKLKADMYYINNRNIKLDMMIIVKTVGVLFTGSGAR
jgi:exopolysaccharide biosynthesis polyprenyl glycosylphosphotransferase